MTSTGQRKFHAYWVEVQGMSYKILPINSETHGGEVSLKTVMKNISSVWINLLRQREVSFTSSYCSSQTSEFHGSTRL